MEISAYFFLHKDSLMGRIDDDDDEDDDDHNHYENDDKLRNCTSYRFGILMSQQWIYEPRIVIDN